MKKNRRDFIKESALAAAGVAMVPTIVPASVMGKKSGFVPPSDRITLGFIGAGNQAGNDARRFLRDERVQITTICDVNAEGPGYWNGSIAGRIPLMNSVNEAYTQKFGKDYKATKGFEDFREVIAMQDLDAVVIETPDHWHAIPVMMAAAAKKDIYCQKPLSLTIAEGRGMSDAVKKYGVVFQTGSQQRSDRNFRRVCELVRNGRIGKLQTVTVGLPGGTPDFGKTGDQTDTVPIPKGFNYDLWLGPAPEAPYCPARTHVNFRWIWDYSGGQVTDWGGHHPDIAQWGMDTEYTGPVRIENVSSKWADHPVYDTATEFHFECVYANGVRLIYTSKDGNSGVKFEGIDGHVWAHRGRHGASSEDIYYSKIAEDEIKLYESNDHYRNFIDCVISRKEPVAPVEIAHRSVSVAHLGNIAMKLNENLDWDPKKEKFKGSRAANKMLERPMRAPWDKVYREHLV